MASRGLPDASQKPPGSQEHISTEGFPGHWVNLPPTLLIPGSQRLLPGPWGSFLAPGKPKPTPKVTLGRFEAATGPLGSSCSRFWGHLLHSRGTFGGPFDAHLALSGCFRRHSFLRFLHMQALATLELLLALLEPSGRFWNRSWTVSEPFWPLLGCLELLLAFLDRS